MSLALTYACRILPRAIMNLIERSLKQLTITFELLLTFISARYIITGINYRRPLLISKKMAQQFEEMGQDKHIWLSSSLLTNTFQI